MTEVSESKCSSAWFSRPDGESAPMSFQSSPAVRTSTSLVHLLTVVTQTTRRKYIFASSAQGRTPHLIGIVQHHLLVKGVLRKNEAFVVQLSFTLEGCTGIA